MRNRFHKRECRCFCPCELCRLRFNRMLYNKVFSGDPLNTYRPGGSLRRKYRRFEPYKISMRIKT